MTPAEAAEIATDVLRLMAGYPSMRLTHEEAARTAATFVAALAGLPLWAVRQACQNWATGRAQASSPAFPPSAPELRIAADAVVRPRQHEAGAIRAVLNADVEVAPTDDERARAVAHWNEVVRPILQSAAAISTPGTIWLGPAAQATDPGSEEAAARERARVAQIEANERVRRRERAALGLDPNKPFTPEMERELFGRIDTRNKDVPG